jgi:uncharacterized integral membrane protein
MTLIKGCLLIFAIFFFVFAAINNGKVRVRFEYLGVACLIAFYGVGRL